MENADLLKKLEQSDMVLVGLGEDFDSMKKLRENPQYVKGYEMIQEAGYHWLIPAWNEFCLEKLGANTVRSALEKLASLLENKNYYVVSVSTAAEINLIPWKHGRCVMPCGSVIKKQCRSGCEEALAEVSDEDRKQLRGVFEELFAGSFPKEELVTFGHCPKCGSHLILNNIYAENYSENGYLAQWQTYMKWLQGTLNRKLLILELGVGMKYPSVIRWPFEKVAYFNQKAYFCRVNQNLYQLTEELSGKGCGISQNAIDWLNQL